MSSRARRQTSGSGNNSDRWRTRLGRSRKSDSAEGSSSSSCFCLEPPSVLTWVSLTEHLDWRGHLLFADAFVLLPLGNGLQPLPGQRAQVEVHEDVAQGLQVVPPGLLCGGEEEESVNLAELWGTGCRPASAHRCPCEC